MADRNPNKPEKPDKPRKAEKPSQPRKPRTPRKNLYDPILPSDVPDWVAPQDRARMVGSTDPVKFRGRVAPVQPPKYERRRLNPVLTGSSKPSRSKTVTAPPATPKYDRPRGRTGSILTPTSSPPRKRERVSPGTPDSLRYDRTTVDRSLSAITAGSSSGSRMIQPLTPPSIPEQPFDTTPQQMGFGNKGIDGVTTYRSFLFGE